jgi:antitoxin YefM
MSIPQISFQECNSKFAQVFDRVLENGEVISIYRDTDESIVMLDAKEYSSLIETLYLLSNSANADRLREGILQYKLGKVKEIDVTAYLD